MLSDREYMYGAPDRGSWFHFGESMVKPLIWANVLVFLLTGAGANERALLLVLLHPYLIQKGEFWRLVTCMFAHGGFMHILFNMWGLYLFGRQLERLIGLRRFAILYFVSGIIGGLVWLSANWHSGHVLLDGQGNVLRISGGLIGASGAVFEVLLSLNEGQGKIAHLAHLGGILGGVVCMLGARLPNGGRFRLFAVFRDWGRRWRMAAAQRRLQKELRVEEGGASGLLDMTAEVDRILDKIGEHGLDSLSSEERRTLEHARRHFRERP
jgi:membrane associated rhomboid family serine protease